MVLFSSQHMLHRVLPSAAERYCFTIWLSEGPQRRGAGGGGVGGDGREELRRALSSSAPLGEGRLRRWVGASWMPGLPALLLLLRALAAACGFNCWRPPPSALALSQRLDLSALLFVARAAAPSSFNPTAGTAEAWRLLLHLELRKHAAKWAHRREWGVSIGESHPAGAALQAALATFERDVAVVERALAPLLPALAAGPPEGLGEPAWF
jgi:hypothetical protein